MAVTKGVIPLNPEQLAAIATSALVSIDHAPDSLPAPLAYVILTKTGAIHTVINDDFENIIQTLRDTQDTAVQAVLAMWKDGALDLPSYAFRTALLELDHSNAQTELAGTRKTLDATMFHG